MELRQAVYEFYWRAKRIIAPTLKYSQYAYEEVLEKSVGSNTRWLDLGCGHHILPEWRNQQEQVLVKRCKSVTGLDYDLESLLKPSIISKKVRGEVSHLPFKNQSFDLVTANMVIEHLEHPEIEFTEVNRILAPGGRFIFHTPNAFGHPSIMTRMVPDRIKNQLAYLLDGRPPGDIFKTHFKANTRKRIDALARANGFEVDEIKLIVSEAVFMAIPPLAVPELFYLRLLMTQPLETFRTNIIAALVKCQ